MPIPSPRNKILPVRGNIASLNAALADLVEGEICYAFDEDQYYQKEGGVLVPVGATKAQGLLADSAIQPGDNVSELTNDAAYVDAAGAAAAAPVQSVAGKTGAVTLVKADVGLSNVDNTSDLNKPISTATQSALNLKADLVGGVIPNSQLPSLAISVYLGSVNSQAAMLALTGQRGDWCIRTDTGSTWVITTDGGSLLSDWTKLATPADAVASVNGYTGTVVLGKADVGLGNVDNTSDLDKPVSTATQTALNLKANLASPALTGTPTAPTATAGTNTAQIATTAFVTDAVNTADEWTRTGTTLAPKTAGDVVSVSAGTAALPGLSVVGDADTGISSSAANTLDISTGGTGRVRVNSTVQTLNEIYGSTYYPVVTQVDVGTGSNQIPLNSYLGTMAFQDASAFTGSIGLGSASYPSLSVTGDENTGLFSPGADQLAISTAGIERLTINAAGLHTFDSSAHSGAALSITAPAKLYVSTGTYTDTSTAASGTVTHGTIAAFDNPAIAATNATVTYTNASTVYIDGAPTGGTNVTVTNGYALYVNAGRCHFGGAILSASPTDGVGYKTGAGGTVTQATSRTTGVTLNKICGAITLVSAAGSTAWQSFTVTNSTVAATDNIIVNQKSGTNLYMLHVTAVAAGSFRITFATTGGTTTEQPVFNFTVLKAVAA